jgi:hypothetical protein
MEFSDLMWKVQEAVEAFLGEAREASASELGLDQRAAWGGVYVTPECLAVRIDSEGSLRYYGGFEYVSKEYRVGMGEWVFYLAEDSRVREHLAHVFPELREGEWEDEEEFA